MKIFILIMCLTLSGGSLATNMLLAECQTTTTHSYYLHACGTGNSPEEAWQSALKQISEQLAVEVTSQQTLQQAYISDETGEYHYHQWQTEIDTRSRQFLVGIQKLKSGQYTDKSNEQIGYYTRVRFDNRDLTEKLMAVKLVASQIEASPLLIGSQLLNKVVQINSQAPPLSVSLTYHDPIWQLQLNQKKFTVSADDLVTLFVRKESAAIRLQSIYKKVQHEFNHNESFIISLQPITSMPYQSIYYLTAQHGLHLVMRNQPNEQHEIQGTMKAEQRINSELYIKVTSNRELPHFIPASKSNVLQGSFSALSQLLKWSQHNNSAIATHNIILHSKSAL